MDLCGNTQKLIKIKKRFICKLKKMLLHLCRYPENNLFTLKKLIPIEDIERLPVKAIALFFCMIHTTSYCKSHMPAP